MEFTDIKTKGNVNKAMKALDKPGTYVVAHGPGGKSMTVTKVGGTYYMVSSRKPRKK